MASTLGEGERKFHEGWTSHRSESIKAWKRCWMVLRGTFIFLFCSDKQSKENMVACLILGHGTSVSDMKSKKEFKFELLTISREGRKRKDIFKFNKENECCLWKAYIVAIATGMMPTDVRLFPGQQSDIYEAMIEAARKRNGGAAGGHPAAAPAPPRSPNGRRPSHRETKWSEIEEEGEGEDDEDFEMNDPAVKQLRRRLEELAKKEIDESQLTLSVSSWPNNEIVDTIGPKGQRVSAYPLSVATPIQATSATTPADDDNRSTTDQLQRTSISFSTHVFYSDRTQRNKIPSWFVNCSRVQAETILTTAKRFGSVLMRPSSQFPINGNYVIGFRRELNGKVVVSHYNIIRSDEGYKIDVENKHAAMESLSVVMEFFLSVAGKAAKALTSNDLTELLGRYQAAAFPSLAEEDAVERRSNAPSSVHSRGLPSSASQPSMSGSNRSSSSIGSLSSRNSRGSSDLVNRRPTDPHAAQPLPSSSSYYTADDDGGSYRLSSAASSVFYGGHGDVGKAGSETGSGGGGLSSPPSYVGGSFYGGGPSSYAGSTAYGDLGVPRSPKTGLLCSVSSVSSPNDDQIYSNQSETTVAAPDNPVSEVGSGSSRGYSGGSASEYGGSETYNNARNVASSSGISGNGWQDQGGRMFGKHRINSPPNAAGVGGSGQYSQNSTLSSGAYAKRSPSKLLAPPPTPPKPGAREIYALMKPLPSTDGGEYSSAQEIGETTDEDSMKPSVKELARMLQCSLEK